MVMVKDAGEDEDEDRIRVQVGRAELDPPFYEGAPVPRMASNRQASGPLREPEAVVSPRMHGCEPSTTMELDCRVTHDCALPVRNHLQPTPWPSPCFPECRKISPSRDVDRRLGCLRDAQGWLTGRAQDDCGVGSSWPLHVVVVVDAGGGGGGVCAWGGTITDALVMVLDCGWAYQVINRLDE